MPKRTDKNKYFVFGIALLTAEIIRRNKFEEWKNVKYSPAEDPTFPTILLEKNHDENWYKKVTPYFNFLTKWAEKNAKHSDTKSMGESVKPRTADKRT